MLLPIPELSYEDPVRHCLKCFYANRDNRTVFFEDGDKRTTSSDRSRDTFDLTFDPKDDGSDKLVSSRSGIHTSSVYP